MKIIKMKEYYELLQKFVNNHEVANVETSSMINGEWNKKYFCEDGAFGTEINRVIYEQVEVEVKGLKIKVDVKLLETEWFDTDNGASIYMYQKY